MLRQLVVTLSVCAASLVAPVLATAQEPQRADLMGSFHLLGPVPPPRPLAAPGPGAPANLVDESLVIGPEQGIANVVIYLQPSPGIAAPAPPARPALLPPVTIAAAGDRFDPHVVVVEVGQGLDLVNRDKHGHAAFCEMLSNGPFSHLLGPGNQITMRFPKEERLPAKLVDSVHPWMSGYLLVAPTPFNAVTDANGSFKISDLPVGTWNFRVWHERIGYLRDVTIQGQFVQKPKGVFTVTIKPGENDLGPMQVPPEAVK